MAPGVLELCIKMQSKNRSPILCNTVNKQEAVGHDFDVHGWEFESGSYYGVGTFGA